MVGCMAVCPDERHPAKYQPIRWKDYMLMRISIMYENMLHVR